MLIKGNVMPYIPDKARRAITKEGASPGTVGELNYAITMLVLEFYKRDTTYQGINDVIGALEGAKLEFYRRVVSPYEEIKLLQNGDIY